MHSENNDFMHGRKIKGRQEGRGWIIVQFYKFEFVLTRQKLQFSLVTGNRAKKKEADTILGGCGRWCDDTIEKSYQARL